MKNQDHRCDECDARSYDIGPFTIWFRFEWWQLRANLSELAYKLHLRKRPAPPLIPEIWGQSITISRASYDAFLAQDPGPITEMGDTISFPNFRSQ